MLRVSSDGSAVRFGGRLEVSFHRTLRIPEGDHTFPLPPSFGRFPIHRVEDFRAFQLVPWAQPGDLFVPIRQQEALWIGFAGADWNPTAVMVGAGSINVVSGEEWSETLQEHPQNYLVCPQQPWLDGINAGPGSVRQFVAMPLGSVQTVEQQLSPSMEAGGIRLRAFAAKPGRFLDQPPAPVMPATGPMALGMGPEQMGIAAGGKVQQKIYPDPFGIATWDPQLSGGVVVHLVNSTQYRELTGREPPPSPIDAKTYAELGLAWFELYDDDRADVEAPERLAGLKAAGDDETPLDPRGLPVRRLRRPDAP